MDGYFGIWFPPLEDFLPSEYTIGPDVMCGLEFNSGAAGNCVDGANELTGGCSSGNLWFGERMFLKSRPQLSKWTHSGTERLAVFLSSRYRSTFSAVSTSGGSTYYAGTNGNTSVAEMYDADPGSGVHNVIKVRDRHGYVYWYFGDDPSSVTRGSTAVSPKIKGQLWKMAYDTGNTDETLWPTMYVGEDRSTVSGWNSLANAYRGFETCETTGGTPGTVVMLPRVKTMFDSAGRRFTYTYSGDSVSAVKKERWSGSAWETISEAAFDYYTSAPVGMLRSIQTIEPTSESSVKVYRYQYFRYDADGRMTMQLTSEGVRRAFFDGSPSVSYTSLPDVAAYLDGRTLSQLKPFAASVVDYYTTGGQVGMVQTITENGQCGCSGGGPSGNSTFTYQIGGTDYAVGNGVNDQDGTYDCAGAWYSASVSKSARRTKVQHPDGTYTVTYYDDTAQVLGIVKCAMDPDGSSHNTTSQTIWATLYERDSDTRVVKVYSPEMVQSYDHANGKFTVYSGATPPGTLTEYVYSTNSDIKGPVVTEVRVNKSGGTGTVPVSITEYMTSGSDWYVDVGGSSGARLVKPLVLSTSVYKNEVSSGSGTNGTDYDKTSYAYTFWKPSGAPWAIKSVQTTQPISITAENGSNTAVATTVYLEQRARKTQFSVDASGRIDFTKYDADTGQVTDSVIDVDASVSDASSAATALGTGVLTLPTSGSQYFKLRTTYTYDTSGRLTRTLLPSSRKTYAYYTRLNDHQKVAVSGPMVTGTPGSETFTGPVAYNVMNLAGRNTGNGLLTLTGSGNTSTAISGWIATTGTNAVLSVGGNATLARFTGHEYDPTGNRLLVSKLHTTFTSTPTTEDTSFKHDGMGRIVGVKDPTGTIRRTTFDARGRVSSQFVGTNDISATGEKFSSSGTDDMTEVSRSTYQTNTPTSGSYKLGTARLANQKQDADGDWSGTTGDQRTTTYTYDYRGRVVVVENSLAPHTLTKYDFRGRVIASGSYSSVSGLSASSDPTASSSTNRIGLAETFYDARGQVWKSLQHKVVQSSGSYTASDALATLNWYDEDGQLLKTTGPGGLMKYAYDRLDRQVRAYTLASQNDTAYGDADDVTGDVVLEESLTGYEASTGNVLLAAAFSRHHDKGTGVTGPLDANADADNLKITDSDLKQSGSVIARAQITGMWYDALDRLEDAVQFGTYALNESGGPTNFTRTAMSVPARSATALRTTTAYDKDGTVLTTTDPRNIATKTLYDGAGRRTATISNFINGVPDNASTKDDDHFVRYVYGDGSTGAPKGLLVRMWVDLDGDDTVDTDDQVTQYIYGTTKGTLGTGTAPASQIATGHLLREAVYPPQTGSQAAADRTVFTAYNALSEPAWTKDQNGTILTTAYDAAGRQTARVADTLGTSGSASVDGAVRRIAMSYTSRGQIDQIVQYDNTSAGNALNGLRYTYDDRGSLTKIEHDRDSAVGASGSQPAVAVEWAYGDSAPSGGRQRVQRNSTTYAGKTFTYTFNSGIDTLVGRVSQIELDSGSTDAQYVYHGQGMVVGTTLTGPSRHSRLYDSGNAYADLDRFNRIVANRWTNTANSADVYRIELAYDENSNITRILDPLEKAAGTRVYDTAYTMDALNRVIEADRGTWSGSAVTGTSRFTQDWSLSQTGNWSTTTVDTNGSGGAEYTDNRTHNAVNEILTRSNPSASPVHDKAGQMTDDGSKYTYVYDAFGRLVTVKNRSTTTTIVEYVYDGLGQRIGWHYDVNASGGGPDASDPWYWFIHDDRWRIVATYRVAGGSGSGSTSFRHSSATTDTNPKERLVYHAAGLDGSGGSSYLDSALLIERDLTTGWGSAADADAESWHYPLTNWRNDTVRVENRDGGILAGYRYSAYGSRSNTLAADFNGDGFVDFFDEDDFVTCYEGNGCPSGATADWNGDGFVDFLDDDAYSACFEDTPRAGGTLRALYAGYQADPVLAFNDATVNVEHDTYHVRHRVYSTDLGRWTRRDPLGYGKDGPTLVEYCGNNPLMWVDFMGLQRRSPSDGDFVRPGENWGNPPPPKSKVPGKMQCYRCIENVTPTTPTKWEYRCQLQDPNSGESHTCKFNNPPVQNFPGPPGDPYDGKGPLPPGTYEIVPDYSPKFGPNTPSPRQMDPKDTTKPNKRERTWPLGPVELDPGDAMTPAGNCKRGNRCHYGTVSWGCLTEFSPYPNYKGCIDVMKSILQRHERIIMTIEEIDCSALDGF